MQRLLYLFVLCSLFSFKTKAQPLYSVTHMLASKTIAGTSVTVTPIASPGSQSSFPCGLLVLPAYWVGNGSNPNAYKFSFSTPAQSIQMRIADFKNGQVARIYINGAQYPLTNANIAVLPGTAPCSTAIPAIVNGDIVAPNPSPSMNAIITISPLTPIDSIRVQHMNGVSTGFYFDMAFEPSLSIDPLPANQYCAGDMFNVSYKANPAVFAAGNFFSVQLSDALGSFAAPKTIGSVAATTSGAINCQIPLNTPDGIGYRMRVVSLTPTAASASNTTNIKIDRFPIIPRATSNSPVCVEDTLILKGQNIAPGVHPQWLYPSHVVDTAILVRQPIQLTDSGWYYLKSTYFSCIALDSVYVTVKYTPKLGGKINPDHATICEEDTIRLSFDYDKDTPGISYTWYGPEGFYDTGVFTVRNHVSSIHSGRYGVIAKYKGCEATTWTDPDILVKPKPDSIWVKGNNSLITGETLYLQTGSKSPGSKYQWTGPDNLFLADEQLVKITSVGQKNEGIYFVKVNLDGCSRQTFITVFVHQLPFDDFKLYPNPAKDHVHIWGPIQKDQDCEVKIFNAYGQKIYRQLITTTGSIVDHDIPLPGHLAAGWYTLRIYVDRLQRDYLFQIQK